MRVRSGRWSSALPLIAVAKISCTFLQPAIGFFAELCLTIHPSAFLRKSVISVCDFFSRLVTWIYTGVRLLGLSAVYAHCRHCAPRFFRLHSPRRGIAHLEILLLEDSIELLSETDVVVFAVQLV